jgi:hypothetical protein
MGGGITLPEAVLPSSACDEGERDDDEAADRAVLVEGTLGLHISLPCGAQIAILPSPM